MFNLLIVVDIGHGRVEFIIRPRDFYKSYNDNKESFLRFICLNQKGAKNMKALITIGKIVVVATATYIVGSYCGKGLAYEILADNGVIGPKDEDEDEE